MRTEFGNLRGNVQVAFSWTPAEDLKDVLDISLPPARASTTRDEVARLLQYTDRLPPIFCGKDNSPFQGLALYSLRVALGVHRIPLEAPESLRDKRVIVLSKDDKSSPPLALLDCTHVVSFCSGAIQISTPTHKGRRPIERNS